MKFLNLFVGLGNLAAMIYVWFWSVGPGLLQAWALFAFVYTVLGVVGVLGFQLGKESRGRPRTRT